MPTVMSLERPRMPTFLGMTFGDSAIGTWIMSQSAPVAIVLSMALAGATGLAVGGAAIWAKHKVAGR